MGRLRDAVLPQAGERPDLIKLNVVCAGTILIKGIELLHTPLK